MDYFTWTVDGLVETNGLGIYTAVSGGHIEWDEGSLSDRDMYGYLIQAGYNIDDNLWVWRPQFQLLF